MQHAAPADVHPAGVLILGAGLAGLRAGIAALETAPSLSVTAIGLGPGSSFANINDALGMQVPRTDAEQEFLYQRILHVARPGWVNPALARLLVQEAEPRFRDMQDYGAIFATDQTGKTQRIPGCFLQNQTSAVVFHDLQAAGQAFARRFQFLGGRLLRGLRIIKLLQNEPGGRVNGGEAVDDAGSVVSFPARATVMALGGPAPLYELSVAGPGGTGMSYGLLDMAGATLANERYIQFLWHTLQPRTFFPVARLAEPGVSVLDAAGRPAPLPDELRSLALSRAGHCPFAYGFDDAQLDLFLAQHIREDGAARIILPEHANIIRVAPMAHAGNGGAVVDADGFTGVPGLYAAGECATGMHGANRVGGAMVAATQVFGRRAGIAAARAAQNAPEPLALAAGAGASPPCPDLAAWLGRELQRCAAPGGGPRRTELAKEIREKLMDNGLSLAEAAVLRSGLRITSGT